MPMKLKMIPPLVLLVFAGMMLVLARFLPMGQFDFFGRQALKYVLWILGLAILMTAAIQFRLAHTTTNPLTPEKTSRLVISGIFGYTRNPMYLAMLLFLLGLGLHLGNAFNTLVAAGFVYYMNHFQIKAEEQVLAQLFGKEYKLYCKAVRRWF